MLHPGEKLRDELRIWSTWSRNTDQGEQGWQSDAPNWQRLMNSAQELLLRSGLEPSELAELEAVFEISEEGEELGNHLRLHLTAVAKDTIQALTKSTRQSVRWQIYDALDGADAWSEALLCEGLHDSDPYVRRRAFLRLVSTKPTLLPELIERFAADPDKLNRETATRFRLSEVET